MNSKQKFTESVQSPFVSGKGRLLLILLAILISVEALLVTVGAIYFFSQIFIQEVNNMAGAIVIFAIAAFIALGLFAVSIACFKDKAGTLGAIVTWQILQFAAGTSFILGMAEWQALGWLLILLSISAIVVTVIRLIVQSSK